MKVDGDRFFWHIHYTFFFFYILEISWEFFSLIFCSVECERFCMQTNILRFIIYSSFEHEIANKNWDRREDGTLSIREHIHY